MVEAEAEDILKNYLKSFNREISMKTLKYVFNTNTISPAYLNF